MEKRIKKRDAFEGLQVWKVIGIFAMVFLAVQLAVSFIGISTTALMDWSGAGDNLRVFVGSSFSRAGMIAAVILICAPVIRKVFQADTRVTLFPFSRNGLKNLAVGMAISACVMGLIFVALLLFNQLRIERPALSGQPLDAWLRAIWLALLVNVTAAISEEVLFRGLLLTGLKKAWDDAGAVFISAVIFSASHLVTASAGKSNWLEFVPLLALPGAMLGWAYLRSGSLWLPTGIHFAWNFFQDDFFNLAARNTSTSLFGWITAHNGPTWLLGTDYGIEVGLVGVLSTILVSVGVWLYTRKPAPPQ